MEFPEARIYEEVGGDFLNNAKYFISKTLNALLTFNQYSGSGVCVHCKNEDGEKAVAENIGGRGNVKMIAADYASNGRIDWRLVGHKS